MTVRNMRPVMREKIQYISPDGLVYELDDRPKRSVLQMTGWGNAPANRETARSPYQAGSTLVGFDILERTISFTFRHNGCSRQELWTNRAEFLNNIRVNRTNMLYPTEGTLRWYTADNNIYSVNGFFVPGNVQAGSVSDWDEFSFVEDMNFVCSNPIIYYHTAQTLTVTGFNVSDTQTDSITYTGTWQEFPVIVLTGPADAGSYFQNTTTGLIVNFDRAVAGGETVTFDLRPKVKTVVSSTGGNVFSGVDVPNSDLTRWCIEADPIAANGTNAFEFFADGATAATQFVMTYYLRYSGVM